MQLITQSYFEPGGPSASPGAPACLCWEKGHCGWEAAVYTDPSEVIVSHKSEPCTSQEGEVQPGQGERDKGHLSPGMRTFQQLARLWPFLQDVEAMVLTQHRERRVLESSDLGGGSQLFFFLLCDFRQVL